MKLVVVLAALLATAWALPINTGRVVMGRAAECVFDGSCKTHDWTLISLQNVVPAAEVPLEFSIKSIVPEDQCSSLLMEVADPTSPKYGQQLSFEEIGQMFANREGAALVKNWLINSGVPEASIEVTPNAEFVSVRVPHTLAERLLATKFRHYHSQVLNRRIARTHEYSLPAHVAAHVNFVGNAVSFPHTLRKPAFFTPLASGSTDIALLNKFYNIASNKVSSPNATQSLFESLSQSYSETDLAAFQSKYKLPRQKIVKVIGPNNPNDCKTNPDNCGEANLDVQYMMAVAQGAPTTFWSVPGDVEPFVDWVKAVSATANPPLVHSISYGSVESSNDPTEVKTFNTELCKLGLRGLTVLISSGDDGVANFVARQDSSQCGFNPSYPAACPFATSVGATQGPEDGKKEIACTSDAGGLITTGGGFSTLFSTPSWQAQAVANYYKVANSTLPPTNLFNNKGRGYPDISVMGHNYVVNIGGQFYQVSGTSASAPVFGGMVTLVNDARLAAGKKPLGFLNPALYQLSASALLDTTDGKNNCCAGEPGSQVCCQYGFSAAAGWDPLTGLGSVNFANFKSALLALP